MIWFGLTYSAEQYEQANARLNRPGQKETVVIHHLVAKGTVDEKVMAALQKKTDTQNALLDALRNYMTEEMTAP